MKKLLPLLLLTFVLGCPASKATLTRDAYNGLIGLKATYVTANTIRNAYCEPKTPKPQICLDSFKPFQKAYDLLVKGTDLLLKYSQTQAEDARTALISMIPDFTQAGIEILGIERQIPRN